MKKIVLFLLFIISNSYLFYAQPYIQWQRSLGGSVDDRAYSIQQTTDGGYIIAGFSNSNDGDVTGNHGDYDYWIVKLNNTGAIEWQKSKGVLVLIGLNPFNKPPMEDILLQDFLTQTMVMLQEIMATMITGLLN